MRRLQRFTPHSYWMLAAPGVLVLATATELV